MFCSHLCDSYLAIDQFLLSTWFNPRVPDGDLGASRPFAFWKLSFQWIARAMNRARFSTNGFNFDSLRLSHPKVWLGGRKSSLP